MQPLIEYLNQRIAQYRDINFLLNQKERLSDSDYKQMGANRVLITKLEGWIEELKDVFGN